MLINISILNVLILLLSGSLLSGADYFVTVDGSPSGDGATDNPWNLQRALTNTTRVRPGDTIWVSEGTYAGAFVSRLVGTQDIPIIVRARPGERVILDGALTGNAAGLSIRGANTWFWGLEIANTNSIRELKVAGSNPAGRRGNSVDVYASRVKLINLIIHDSGQGPGLWSQAENTEVYGCIVYNNGWIAPDRRHGHGVYAQNRNGEKVFRDNIIFNSLSANIHMYGSSQAFLENFLWEGNTVFNGGALFGGSTPVKHLRMHENYFFRNEVAFGYDVPSNDDVELRNNYFTNGIALKYFRLLIASGNTFLQLRHDGQSKIVSAILPEGVTLRDYQFDRNHYFQSSRGGDDFWTPGTLYTFKRWQAQGLDSNGTYTHTKSPDWLPAGVRSFVRPNKYDPTRANIIIYNWDKLSEVSVDLSAMKVKIGDKLELRNVQNYFQESITVTYTGMPIKVPMRNWTVASPVGMSEPIAPTTFPIFGVFVLHVQPNAAR